MLLLVFFYLPGNKNIRLLLTWRAIFVWCTRFFVTAWTLLSLGVIAHTNTADDIKLKIDWSLWALWILSLALTVVFLFVDIFLQKKKKKIPSLQNMMVLLLLPFCKSVLNVTTYFFYHLNYIYLMWIFCVCILKYDARTLAPRKKKHSNSSNTKKSNTNTCMLQTIWLVSMFWKAHRSAVYHIQVWITKWCSVENKRKKIGIITCGSTYAIHSLNGNTVFLTQFSANWWKCGVMNGKIVRIYSFLCFYCWMLILQKKNETVDMVFRGKWNCSVL